MHLGSVTFAPKLWSGLICDSFYSGAFLRFPLLALASLFGLRASFALTLDPQQHPSALGVGSRSRCCRIQLPLRAPSSWGFASGTPPGLSQLESWAMAPVPLPLPEAAPAARAPLLPKPRALLPAPPVHGAAAAASASPRRGEASARGAGAWCPALVFISPFEKICVNLSFLSIDFAVKTALCLPLIHTLQENKPYKRNGYPHCLRD